MLLNWDREQFYICKCFVSDPGLVQEHQDDLILPAGPGQGQSQEVYHLGNDLEV